MILEDLHTHTTYCDGKDSPEDMVKSAIEKGLRTIGFSGHIYMPHATYCIRKENMTKYVEEINCLKEKYKGKIKILCGIETDLYSDEDLSSFDYVIGSVHDIRIGNEFLTIDHTREIWESGVNKFFDGDQYSAAESYFPLVVECIKKSNANIIGHFDLITKFNEGYCMFDETHPRYVAAYQKAIDALIPFDKPIEINTGAMSRGYRTEPYPCLDILKYIVKKGGKFILSGDTHAKENLCYCFDKAAQIAKNAGITKLCTSDDIM